MGILKKVQFYKRALQVVIALNIAVLTAGIIAGVGYFSSVKFLGVLTEQNVSRLQQLQVMQNDLTALSNSQNDKKIQTQRIRHLESLRIRLENWPGSSFAQVTFPENYEGNEVPTELINSIRTRITNEERNLGDQLVDATNKLGALSIQLFILGLCTLIFGVILPYLLFKKLNREVQKARTIVEEKVSQYVVSWLETHKQHGEKAFQDPTFWLKIALLAIEAIAPHTRYPAMQFLADFAPTLRKEFEKQAAPDAAVTNGNPSAVRPLR